MAKVTVKLADGSVEEINVPVEVIVHKIMEMKEMEQITELITLKPKLIKLS